MHIRYMILGGIVLLIGYFCWLLMASFANMKARRRYRQAIVKETDLRDRVWLEAGVVKGAVDLYIQMVAKHGPGSQEAKAFRFQMDSPIMKQLHGDKAALAAFNQQADIVDRTWGLIKKGQQPDHRGL